MEIRNEGFFRPNLLILVLFSAAISITAPAFAIEWHKAYERGRDRIKSGDCGQGKSLMLEALRGNPKADPRTPTYGTMVIEYFPQYYLAICAVEAGKIPEAQRYLKESEGSRITSSKLAGEFQTLKARVAQMVQQQQQPAPKPAETKPPVKEPIKQQKPPPPVVEKKSDPPVQDATRDNQIAIQAGLREANRALLDGHYEDARAAANRVLGLDGNNREARNILSQITARQAEDQLAKEKQQKFRAVEQAIRRKDFDTAENLALALKELYPSDTRVGGFLQEIENERNALVQDQKDQELRKNAEKEVLTAYYRGEYDQVIQLVNQNSSKGKQSWRLHFFLGCSYAALSMLEESGTETRLTLARESFRRAKSISSSPSLPPYISPKILEIWRSS